MNLKQRIINYLLKALLVQPQATQVVSYYKDRTGRLVIKLGSTEVTQAEMATLQEEVKYFEQTRLYQIYQNTLAELARQKMFEKSEKWEDMFCGKMMLRNLELQREIDTIIKTWKKPEIIQRVAPEN
jgi:hypothetical protein